MAQTISNPAEEVRGAAVPLWLVVTAFCATLVGCYLFTVSKLHGEFAYALDDPYIHMSTAKNFALHGVWGINSDEFTSATSSIAWPMLIAGLYKVTGPIDWLPFILNGILAVGCLWATNRLLDQLKPAKWIRWLTLILMAVATPLLLLCFIGMEHTLHIFAALLFLASFRDYLHRNGNWRLDLPLLALLLTSIRFEAIFLVFVTAILLIRNWKLAASMFIGGLVPIVLYGLASRHYGAMFLPNSVLIKGNGLHDGLLRLVTRPFWDIANTKMGLACLILAAATALVSKKERALALLVAGTIYLHLMFAQQGWLFRYEAYLVAMTIAVCVPALLTWLCSNFRPSGASGDPSGAPRSLGRPLLLLCVACATVFFGITVSSRIYKANSIITQACKNIHDQQFQMAKFVRENYNHKRVALIDIGAVSYYADVHVVDVVGLANTNIARAKYEHRFDAEALYPELRNPPIDLAIIFPFPIDNTVPIPPEWKVAGKLTIADNYVCAEPTTAFYAPDSAFLPQLVDQINKFRDQVPPDVTLQFEQ